MALLSQEEIEKIKNIKGEVVGTSFHEDEKFIRQKEGEEGVKKVEEEMAKLGYPFRFKELKSFQLYPMGLNLAYVIVEKNIFGWGEEVFRENGRFNARISIIAKIMVKYFVSLKKCFDEAGNFWQKYYTAGHLKTEYLDEKKRSATLALEGFEGHPLLCLIYEGYFWQVISYVAPKETLKVQEIECPFKGGKVHRFQVTW